MGLGAHSFLSVVIFFVFSLVRFFLGPAWGAKGLATYATPLRGQ